MNKITHGIKHKSSFLCIGLDSDISKLPQKFRRYKNPVLEFNKAVIETTAHTCVSYKLNTAFYESRGSKGWIDLEKTLELIPQDIFTIADAKRGDIGNTAAHYAKAFFESMCFDAVTVNPYMGLETLDPYLKYDDKVTIVLALTSNKGAFDFETQPSGQGEMLYTRVLKQVTAYAPKEQIQFVVGATQSDLLKSIRNLVPAHFFLVPGVGTQGGNLQDVFMNGRNGETGLLVNVSRGIIFAGNDSKNSMKEIGKAAEGYAAEMKELLKNGQ